MDFKMGTVPDPKRTMTAEMVPQPEVVDSFERRDPCASEYKLTLDSKLVSVSAPQEQTGNLSFKTNGGGIEKSSDNSQPKKGRASNTLTSPTEDHEKTTSTSSTEDHKNSTFTSPMIASVADHKESSLNSCAGDHDKSTTTSSAREHGKSSITSFAGDDGKSTIAFSSIDDKLSTMTSCTVEPEKFSFTSSSGDHGKSTITSSTGNHRKSTIISSTGDLGKSSATSTTGDLTSPMGVHNISNITSSTRDPEKSKIISSPRDHEKSNINSSPRDHEKSNITSSNRDPEKSNITSSPRDREKSNITSSPRDHERSNISFSTKDHGKSSIASSPIDHKKPELLSRKDVELDRDHIGECVSDIQEDSRAEIGVLLAAEKEVIHKTSLSVSAVISSRPSSQTNDTGENVLSLKEVLVQSTKSSAMDTSEYLQTPHCKLDVTQGSDQVSHPTLVAPLALTTKQDKTADVRTCDDATLSQQSKDYGDATHLPYVLPKFPVQTGDGPQTSDREATGSILANLQQEKRKKTESPGTDWSEAVSVSSGTPVQAHEGAPSTLKMEVRDFESTSHSHLPSSPGGRQSKADKVSTVGRASRALGATAEEAQEAQQGSASRYKEAATMTVSTEHCLTSEHSCHDAGVQAVASVCSRSVGTSPGLLAQGGLVKLNSTATEGQETLTVTCQRSSRSVPSYQITMDSQSGILSDVCSQTLVSSQIHGESSHLTSKQICDRVPGLNASQCSSQTTGVIHHPDPALKPDGRGQGSTKEPVDKAQKWLPLLQPVYQINIEPCSQSNAPSNASPRDKESQVADSTCQREKGSESGSGRDQAARGCFPGTAASNDVCQASVETVALPTRSVKSPAVRSSPSQIDDLDKKEANPSRLNTSAGKPTAGRLPQQQQAPQKQDGRICKSGQSKDGQRKKESERTKATPGDQKERSQTGCDGKAGCQGKAKSVHDVVWDEQGMTWEVYGASADPESLGFAIQSHLQCKIREQERLIKAQVERRRSAAPGSPAGKRTKRRQPKLFRSLMKNVRRPNCCARPPPSSVTE